MTSMRIFLGTSLIVVAVIILLGLVVVPILPGAADNPMVLQFLAAVACEPGERASVEVIVTTDSDGTGYTPELTCIGRERERTDASARLFIIAGIGFTVPLLLGIFLLVFSLRGLKSDVRDVIDVAHEVAGIFQSVSQHTSGGMSALDAGLSPNFKANITGAGTVNLVAKLKELQEALDAGLITQAEFDRLRTDILDKMRNP